MIGYPQAARATLASREHIVRAAQLCHDRLTERINQDPDSPLVPDLQIIAEHAEAIITDNEQRNKQ